MFAFGSLSASSYWFLRVNQGDHQIKVIGKLVDFASEEEINEFYGSIIVEEKEENVVESDGEEENNFII